MYPPPSPNCSQLPGVGRYTAGAVASIAYNAPVPILDGNVARVLSRYLGLATPLDQPATQRTLWDEAADLVERSGHPRDFNQSLMELGALICTPRAAKCLYCPLRDGCNAFATGRVNALPVKPPKKRPLAVTHTILALKRRGRYLFERRPDTGLWAGMWQMPTVEGGVVDGPRGRVAARLAPRDLLDHARQRFRLTVDAPECRGSFTHATTHRSIRFDLYHAPRHRRPPPRPPRRLANDCQTLQRPPPRQAAAGRGRPAAKIRQGAAAMTTLTPKNHIVQTPDTCGNKPRVDGTRIRVIDIYSYTTCDGWSPEQIVEQFPQLTLADVHAALAFYWDHREAIEAEQIADDEFVQQIMKHYPSKLTRGSTNR